MTWGPASRSMVECNAPNHVGNRSHLVEHGAHISAVVAIGQTGWHYNQRTQRHICPECAAITKARASL